MRVGLLQHRAGILALVAAGSEAVVRGTSLLSSAGDPRLPPPVPMDWLVALLVVVVVATGGVWILGTDQRRSHIGAGIAGSMGALGGIQIPATVVALVDLPAERVTLLLGAATGLLLAVAGGLAVLYLIEDASTWWEWPLANPSVARVVFLGASLVLAITINPTLTNAVRLVSVGVHSGVDLAFRQVPASQLTMSLFGLGGFLAIAVVASSVRPTQIAVGAGAMLVVQGLQYAYVEAAFVLGWTTDRQPASDAASGLTAWFWIHLLAVAGILASMFFLARSAAASTPPPGRLRSRATT